MNPSPYNYPWYEEVASLWNIMEHVVGSVLLISFRLPEYVKPQSSGSSMLLPLSSLPEQTVRGARSTSAWGWQQGHTDSATAPWWNSYGSTQLSACGGTQQTTLNTNMSDQWLTAQGGGETQNTGRTDPFFCPHETPNSGRICLLREESW